MKITQADLIAICRAQASIIELYEHADKVWQGDIEDVPGREAWKITHTYIDLKKKALAILLKESGKQPTNRDSE